MASGRRIAKAAARILVVSVLTTRPLLQEAFSKDHQMLRMDGSCFWGIKEELLCP
jgi:hypothetical protein